MKAKKRISITLMIFPFLIAALLLSGCSPASSLDENTVADAADSAAEAANSLADSTEQAADAAEVLAGLDFTKTARLVVCDPQTGNILTEITDQTAVEKALAPLSQENAIARTPNSPEEYLFEMWQPDTIKAGQDASEISDEKVLEITTYQNSDTITVSMVALGGISLSMDTPDGAKALRELVE